ncbi:hypothetical protein N781_03555 [Pontibacillus halophilus JSM 076056 = DSM 19796]|uniref:Uncharacterized protein n=1 Tax=Pontibacillus halophilus JSM 076056 = DSM 19796 TaxID=1385510 RepID=A0A0A5GI39_9BACI|nr:hypothetical protein [Pontibacillus halophilus]KGX91674.1 hypothetical protein N781_03555 [Pontibacillus halophilus JSM 076056 = DSM 19796]
MNDMKEFLYQLQHVVQLSQEMKEAYERLGEGEQQIIRNHAPFGETPLQLNKEITEWYENLYEHSQTKE